jgi:hypothetical protein
MTTNEMTLESDFGPLQMEAQSEWFAAHPDCTKATDCRTDEIIAGYLGNLQAAQPENGIYERFYLLTQQEFKEQIAAAMDAWYGTVDTSAVEYYDQLPDPSARREYREATDYNLSVATKEQLDAIDAGRKAPCLA